MSGNDSNHTPGLSPGLAAELFALELFEPWKILGIFAAESSRTSACLHPGFSASADRMGVTGGLVETPR
jgi:hypothetical protein